MSVGAHWWAVQSSDYPLSTARDGCAISALQGSFPRPHSADCTRALGGWGLLQGRGSRLLLARAAPPPPPALAALRLRGAVQPQCRAGRLLRAAPPARLRSWSPALHSRPPAPPHPAPPLPVHCSPRARAGREAARRGSERRGGAGSGGTRGGDRRPRTAAGGAAVRGCGGSRKPRAAGAVSAPGRPMA